MSARTCTMKDCRRPVWEQTRHCIDHHPGGLSGTTLAQQLQKARDDIADLEAELRATRAVVVTERMEKNTGDFTLLEQVAKALLDAAVVEKALTGASTGGTDSRPAVARRNDHPAPGASTAAARGHARRLRRDLTTAIQQFEQAKEHDWRPPRPEQAPRLRCRIRGCPAVDVEVPAWRHVKGGRRINATHCAGCGTPLPGADTDEDTTESPSTAMNA